MRYTLYANLTEKLGEIDNLEFAKKKADQLFAKYTDYTSVLVMEPDGSIVYERTRGNPRKVTN